MRYFIEISKDILNDEIIYKELTVKYDRIVKPVESGEERDC